MARKLFLAVFIVSGFLMPARMQAGENPACDPCWGAVAVMNMQCYAGVLNTFKQAQSCKNQPKGKDGCWRGSLTAAQQQSEGCGKNLAYFLANKCKGECMAKEDPKPLPPCEFCGVGIEPAFPDKAEQKAWEKKENERLQKCRDEVKKKVAAHQCNPNNPNLPQ